MKKEISIKVEKLDLDYVSLDDLILELTEIKLNNPDATSFMVQKEEEYHYGNGPDTVVVVYKYRQETDEEYQERLDENKKWVEDLKQKELQDLKRLKEKYPDL